MRSIRRWQIAALVALAPVTAKAQFTTYIEPRKEKAEAAAIVAAADSAVARADSTRPQRLTDLKAWVDSAAGVVAAAPRPTVTDTARGEVARPSPAPAPPPRTTTSFKEGAAAPNTATALPTLVLIGSVMLGAGLLLLYRRPPETVECVERPDAS